MKKILLILCVQVLSSVALLRAQSFTAADTVWASVGSNTATIYDYITNNTGSNVTLRWQVIGTNFPASWQIDTAFGICDNNVCRGNAAGALWNGTSGNAYTSNPYPPGPGGAFDLSLNFTGVVTGTHYVTISLSDLSSGTSQNITFVISNAPLAVTNLNSGINDILLYPNPARDELNVVYNANADVKNIVVYNIIGKVMTVYKVIGDSANLNLENIPSGIYFVRLTNSRGEVVATRKFTKQ